MSNFKNVRDSTDAKIERAKDAALGSHKSAPSHFDEAGEGVGGIGGTLAGAAIGSAAGPLGTVIGGIAGAVGGWWAGRAVTEATSKLTESDDEFYRADYDRSALKLADRSYDDMRPAYLLGHLASHNPDYTKKNWSDVQPDLQRGWTVEHARKHGDWATASNFASKGFTRGRIKLETERSRAAETELNSFEKL